MVKWGVYLVVGIPGMMILLQFYCLCMKKMICGVGGIVPYNHSLF